MEEEKIEIKIIDTEESDEAADIIYINVSSNQLQNSDDESTELEFIPAGMCSMRVYLGILQSYLSRDVILYLNASRMME